MTSPVSWNVYPSRADAGHCWMVLSWCFPKSFTPTQIWTVSKGVLHKYIYIPILQKGKPRLRKNRNNLKLAELERVWCQTLAHIVSYCYVIGFCEMKLLIDTPMQHLIRYSQLPNCWDSWLLIFPISVLPHDLPHRHAASPLVCYSIFSGTATSPWLGGVGDTTACHLDLGQFWRAISATTLLMKSHETSIAGALTFSSDLTP